MAKAVIEVQNCVGNGLVFPCRTDSVEVSDTYQMSIPEAKKHALVWCRRNGRTLVSVSVKIVYGHDGM